MVREIALASRLGVSPEADVAVLALTFPDLLTAFLVGGSVSAILVPSFARLLQTDGDALAVLLRRAQLVAVTVGATLALAITLLSAPLVGLLAPGFGPAQRAAAEPVLAVVGLAIPFGALAAVTTAYLQARGRFAVPALGTVVVNGVLVVGILLAVTPADLVVLGRRGTN